MTAQKGASITILGEAPEDPQLTIWHTGKTYPFRLATVKGLHNAINISGPWLKTIGWDDLHSVGCLSIKGTQVPLVGHETAEPDVSRIFMLQNITIQARTGRTINALVPDVRGHQATPGLGCFKIGDRLPAWGYTRGSQSSQVPLQEA